jgi:G2/mitotic-specific cyclin-B3
VFRGEFKFINFFLIFNFDFLRKRKAELSPIKNERVKRSALGNLTNALISTESDEILKKATALAAPKNVTKFEATGVKPVSSRTRAAAKVQTKGSKKAVLSDLLPPPPTKETIITTAIKSKPAVEVSHRNASRRISNEFEKTEESLYVSALEEIPSDVSRLSYTHRKHESSSSSDSQSSAEYTLSQTSPEEDRDNVFSKEFGRLPHGVENFDKENWNDPYQVSHYAMQIFVYLKQREPDYKIKDYMNEQPELSKWMRSLLVDWMVEVQESFELNHETLYLAVKIVDSYLGRERVTKDSLQLLGAAALLIACKYDVSFLIKQFENFHNKFFFRIQERTPPLIDDFLFICDGAYKRSQLLKMEITVFKSIKFDLAFPLSYRFLRRYARVSRTTRWIIFQKLLF